ncbi:MSMEG_0570 family nitrogen starvation response protein [Modestobacter sp. I12A-02628]|uniref:MSMEG_0570 family nitrogen starvation response protein n=1 Tax=Goekera deserti TaxID=2497753 RepID=A0A7K3WET3_9ACTN|nr:MSMEG_0570 family nitrogen starvation response protein [Goekera deserti]MPQ97973.1 MSMEG_0570 family nitrogen starvation response protein [Goekera deserti]NDI48620.1 MSMEG_0570 family nitrogen starvation response protein [Goekera deserti]NEL55001.1 MSMEG_0570 family nitrogen starvation response protein [Goekera deserti]
MPEVVFDVRWPDGSVQAVYSPSLVVEETFEVGRAYELGDFLDRSRTALQVASDRVLARYGFPCSRAAAALAGIEGRAAGFPGGEVTVLAFHR